MAKNTYLIWLSGLVIVLGLAWYFLWSAVTPNGQPPLTRLNSEQQFVTQFDQAANKTRMVLLLSPT